MGAVFRATHTLTGRAVAVKVLNGEHLTNLEAADRFLREARTVAGLKHPNVVDVLDMGDENNDTVFMVLELLEGEPLSRMLAREKRLSVERAAELLLPVMRAVAYAHEREVVHRDLKPENIFIHRDAQGHTVPKILDFGIAKALKDPDARVTQAGFVLGTPAYMSPEQAEGLPDRIGPASDVWSMGVVWYECLTGEMPFEGPTSTAVLLAVASGKFQRLVKRAPSVPVPLASAVDKALVRDQLRRYANMTTFLEAITRAMATGAEATHEPSAPPSLFRGTTPPRERASSSPWSFNDQDLRGSSPHHTPTDAFIELGITQRRDDPPVTFDGGSNEPVLLLEKRRQRRRIMPLVLACGLAGAAGLALVSSQFSPDAEISAPEQNRNPSPLTTTDVAPLAMQEPSVPDVALADASPMTDAGSPDAAVRLDGALATVADGAQPQRQTRPRSWPPPNEFSHVAVPQPPLEREVQVVTPPPPPPPPPPRPNPRTEEPRNTMPRENAPMRDYENGS
jgi:serine/threonine-protein kinase